MSTTAWILVAVFWVGVFTIVASTIVWTHRRDPGDVRHPEADAEFMAALAKSTGRLSSDLRLWRAHYNWLALQYGGNPPADMTAALFDRLLEAQNPVGEERAA